MSRAAYAFVLAGALVGTAIPARACSVCNLGDATITMVGQERPYRNRVRVALDNRLGAARVGDGLLRHDQVVLVEALQASWAPHDRFLLGAHLPWQLAFHHDAAPTVGLGDLEVSGRLLLFRDRRFAPSHWISAVAGLKTPTGGRVRAARGYPLAEDEQPGSGSWDPYVGLSYAAYPTEYWSVFLTTQGRYASPNRRGYARGSAFNAIAGVQYQPHTRFGVQLSFEVLWRDVDRLPNRAAIPDTGGTVLRFWPGLVVAPVAGVLIRAAVGVPIAEALHGTQDERVSAQLTVSYDIR